LTPDERRPESHARNALRHRRVESANTRGADGFHTAENARTISALVRGRSPSSFDTTHEVTHTNGSRTI